MRVIVVVAIAGALSGCTVEYSPIRDGAEPFDQANGECIYRGEQASAPHGNNLAGALTYRRVYDSCMRARGWAPK